MLGIDARDQRIARAGHSVYQSLMRLSLRNPAGTHDVTLVLPDRDVAHWMVQWFEPASQVEIVGIEGDLAHKSRGRPPAGTRAMTNAERQRRWWLRHHRGP